MPSAFLTAAGDGSATAGGTDTPNELFDASLAASLAESLDEDDDDALDGELEEDDGVVEDVDVENE